MKVRNRRPALAAVAAAAVLLALTAGGAVAGHKVTSKDIKNHTIRGKDVHSASLGYNTLTKAARTKLRTPPTPIGHVARTGVNDTLPDNAAHDQVLALSDAQGTGPLTLKSASTLVVNAAVDLSHSGGNDDLSVSIGCDVHASNGSSDVTVVPALFAEVYGQSNHTAHTNLTLTGAAPVGPGSWDVKVFCWKDWPESSPYPRFQGASMYVMGQHP